MGYQESIGSGQVEQSPMAIRAIYIGFAVIPAIAVIAGMISISGYSLEPDDLRESQRGRAEGESSKA